MAKFFDRAVTIAAKIKSDTSKLKDFKAALADGPDKYPELVKVSCSCDLKPTSHSCPIRSVALPSASSGSRTLYLLHVVALLQLRDEVIAFARDFPAIGFDESTMRYPQ